MNDIQEAHQKKDHLTSTDAEKLCHLISKIMFNFYPVNELLMLISVNTKFGELFELLAVQDDNFCAQ